MKMPENILKDDTREVWILLQDNKLIQKLSAR